MGDATPRNADASNGPEPVAIIGLSFRFGGEATSPDSFWRMLLDARTARSGVPADRFNAEAFYHPDTKRLDRLPIKYGNFVTNDIAAFDAPFFSIQPAEAAAMDPQSRKLLETTYRALENAGIPIENCANTKTCVYTGISSDDYRLMYVKDTSYPIRHAATGMALSMLANKISWFYDFKGPSMQLDTACSASLNALHLAVRSIQTGESDMGIVGGANLCFTPESMSPLAHLNFFSPDSRCYSFDHRANGYSRGDGYGVLVLKPLSKALADRDPIRAIIRGTASNENGRTVGGITKVNLEAQRALIETAYRNFGLDPGLTRYVEAHAPGTEGDIVEATALASVFSQHRSTESPLYMGSVKANIGHLEGASGIGSLVKVILMLENGIIPKLANFEEVHSRIRGNEWHLHFPTQTTTWPDGPRQASINSFGFGGANAHVVLQDSGKYVVARQKRQIKPQPLLLVFSTADQEGIARLQAVMGPYLLKNIDNNDTFLPDLAYTLAQRRSRLPWKSALVLPTACGPTESTTVNSLSKPIRSVHTPVLAFIFTGQGAAWARMGTQFLYDDTYCASLRRSNAYIVSLGASSNPMEELSKPSATSRVDEPAFSQYLCTIVQIALVDMLRSFNVVPAFVIGHSSGEIAAAYAAGSISARSACKIAYYRGRIIAREFAKESVYGMLVVGLGETDARPHIDWLGGQTDHLEVFVACVNSPRNITLSGKMAQLQTLKSRLDSQGVFVRILPVPAPYHSPILTGIAEEYQTLLGDIGVGDPDFTNTKMISSVTSTHIENSDLCTAAYWSKNLLSSVQFRPALESLMHAASSPASGGRTSRQVCLVEVGPYGALRVPIRDTLSNLAPAGQASYFSAMVKNTPTADCLYHALGQLHCLGHNVDLMAVNGMSASDVQCLTDLPEYPFNHSRTHWHESLISKNFRFRKHARHDLLGVRVHNWNPLAPRWRNCIRMLENPWIEDHRLAGALIYPAAGVLAMAVEAVSQYVHDVDTVDITGFRLIDVHLHSALHLTTDPEGTSVEFSLTPSVGRIGRSNVPTKFSFRLFVSADASWREVCNGSVAVELNSAKSAATLAELQYANSALCDQFKEWLSACKVPIGRHRLYRNLKEIGLDVGPTFQVFDNVKHNNDGGMAAAEIRLRNWTMKSRPDQVSEHIIHPTALDGMLQLTVVALGAGARRHVPTMVPNMIHSMWISADILSQEEDSLVAVCKSDMYGLRHTISEVVAFDAAGRSPKIVVNGLQTIIIESHITHTSTQENLTMFNMHWIPHEPIVCSAASSIDPVQSEIVITSVNSRSGDESSMYARRLVTPLTKAVSQKVSFMSWQEMDAFVAKKTKKHVHFLCVLQWSCPAHFGTDDIYLAFKSLLPASRSIAWVTLPAEDTSRGHLDSHGAVVGLARTLQNEQPECHFVTINAEQHTLHTLPDQSIIAAFQPARLQPGVHYEPEIRCSPSSTEGGMGLQVSRLVASLADAEIVNKTASMHHVAQRALNAAGASPIKLTIGSPGLLDSLVFVEDNRACNPPLDTQVIVETSYVGLNFLDVLTALGRIPQNSIFGIEGAGTVLEAGPDTDLRPGDRVAMLTDGTLRTRVTADYRTVVKLPSTVSLESAAGMVGTGCTAYRAFVDVAGLQPNETVLIHAGAGATGQMAIQLAQYLGAVVYVTVSSERKRQLVHEQYEIPSEHIFSSRDDSFVAAVKRVTRGRGVDVVLNSVAGELLHTAWAEIVAPFGRWIEIGKRDILDDQGLSMRSFLDNVTFSCIDLTGIWQQRPALMRRLLEDVVKMASNGILRCPWPVNKFGAEEVQNAFRALQNSKGGGKIIIDMSPEKEVGVQQQPLPRWTFRQDRSYVIAGGFGGLGRHIARWMVGRGAKSLIIVSRSGAAHDPTRSALLDELAEAGCMVSVHLCDIANRTALKTALMSCEKQLPSVGGCVQASMTLRVSNLKLRCTPSGFH